MQRDIPPGWTIAEERIGKFLTGSSHWAIHYPEDARPKRSYGLTAAGRLVAAAQVTLYPRAGEGGTFHLDASIGWLAAGDDPGTLGEFLGAIEADVKTAGATEIGLFTRNELGTGWFGVPDAWPALVTGLAAAGYAPGDAWRVMVADLDAVPRRKPPPYAGLSLDVFDRPDEAEHEWVARIRGADAAELLVWNPPAVFSDAPEFPEWTTLEVVEVQAPFTRQGLGRWLLGEAAARLRSRGFRRITAWAETANEAARSLLSGAGFRPVCETRTFAKPLR